MCVVDDDPRLPAMKSVTGLSTAHHKETHEEVAVKLEPANTRHPQVIYEAKVLKLLAGGVGIPPVFWYGKEGSWHGFVTERLGPSLEDLFLFCNKKFSLKTVLMIADQMVCSFLFDSHSYLISSLLYTLFQDVSMMLYFICVMH